MAIETTIKPLSIAAFILTCIGCVHLVVTISLTNWWSLRYSDGVEVDYGVWRQILCDSNGKCRPGLSTKLEGGQEAFFVSKVFASLAALLSVVGVLCHTIYFFYRKPIVRMVASFTFGSASLFAVFAVCVFGGFYNATSGEKSLGIDFILFLVGGIILIIGTILTIWAGLRKLSDDD